MDSFRWALPHKCLFCCQIHYQLNPICAACWEWLPWIEQHCQHCAYPLTHTSVKVCGQCSQDNSPLIDNMQALFRYESPIRELMLGFKYHAQLHYGRILAQLCSNQLQLQTLPDVICAVPVSTHRVQQRGYNQSLEIARFLAKQYQVPLVHDLKKIRESAAQSTLAGKGRRQNLTAKHFDFKPAVMPGRVLLIDDVMTTGSTLRAIAQCLKQSGVTTIEAWVVCRAILAG